MIGPRLLLIDDWLSAVRARGSELAVIAAMSAAKGVTTALDVFEMPHGYFEVSGGGDIDVIADWTR